MLRLSAAGAGTVAPAPRLYYGWVLVGVLGLTETVSYGILQYAFPVFIAPMRAELGWSAAAITGAFSVATLVSGLAAIPAGRWVDRHGARGLMTAGSVLAAATLLAWSRVQGILAFYAVSAAMGLAMAAVLYEPAFAVVATWFSRHRGRALTLLTFLGGFASVVFVPLAAWLVVEEGWRAALVWLAALLAALTIPPHLLLLRRRPQDHGRHPDGAAHAAPPSAPAGGAAAREVVRTASFRWLGAAFALSALTGTALAVHLVPLLLERGRSPAAAAGALGVLGLMALPGRLVFTPLGDRFSRRGVAAAIFLLQAAGTAALLAGTGDAAVWTFVVLFGAGFGAITPARAALVAELYGPASYGAISGTLALALALARAAAPVGASLLYAAADGYGPVLAASALLSLAAAGAVLAARPSSGPIPQPATIP